MRSAARQLATRGACVIPPGDLDACLGVDRQAWLGFARHWEHLVDDPYAAELGTRRLRRYGHYLFTSADETVHPVPHGAFVQPERSNPLYVDKDRHFEPLTEAFAHEPLLLHLLRVLGRFATVLCDLPQWCVKVTPFRVLASSESPGNPTPEGIHRDGVTLVSSLLIGRDNATGGESSVIDADGRPLVCVTLREPGTLLLGDDRRTLHGVTPIRPIDPAKPGRRDVLVVTFAPVDR